MYVPSSSTILKLQKQKMRTKMNPGMSSRLKRVLLPPANELKSRRSGISTITTQLFPLTISEKAWVENDTIPCWSRKAFIRTHLSLSCFFPNGSSVGDT